jgi:soluble lytic murein transglycosylase
MKNRFFKLGVLVILLITLILQIRSGIYRNYPIKYEEYVIKYSQQYGLDKYLVYAVIKAESNFREDVVSHKSANGLMQITDSTGSWIASQIGVKDFKAEMLYDPETNIMFGCWYLDNLRTEFNDVNLVLAAYNAGRGNVKKWLESDEHSKDGKNLYYIPYKETDKYLKKVTTNYNVYKMLYEKK